MRSLLAVIALLGARCRALPLAARGAPSVDLGYAFYEGAEDNKTGINIFKGSVCILSVKLLWKLMHCIGSDMQLLH